ncbi:MAG TPA: hypothetical protein VFA10_01990 [Ktedonobacteraceae bacterium]|nr:hypothetical protein [Ktedonobacteraceae bacterium]
MQGPFSLNDIRERFAERDIEITCTRTIVAEVSIWHGQDQEGRKNKDFLNVTLHLSLDDEDEEQYYAYTFALNNPVGVNPKTKKAEQRPLTLDVAAIALSIDPDEKVWEESTDFDSTTEEYE